MRLHTQAPSTTPEKRTYANHEFDTETNLSFMEARYYAPTMGRFTSQDAVFQALGMPGAIKALTGMEQSQLLADPQALNSYAYARNNPMVYVDVDGNVAVLAVFAGFTNSVVSNAAFGIGRGNFSDSSYRMGQRFGDGVSMAIGAVETAVGLLAIAGGAAGGIITSPTGAGALAGASVSAAGLAMTGHGAGMMSSGMSNLLQRNGSNGNMSNGPKVGDKISGAGVTKHAADQASVRGMSTSKIENALNNGTRYYDQKNNSNVWVIGERGKGGYSVVTTTDKQTIKTVQNFVPNLNSERFIQY